MPASFFLFHCLNFRALWVVVLITVDIFVKLKFKDKIMDFDLIIIGSGPGGYVAAIRASQLGMKVGVVEKAELGGICLNWGCIPTKSLLKSASVFEYIKHAKSYGIDVNGEASVDFSAMVNRSREVAAGMSKGVQYLFKKNKIELIQGTGKLTANKTVEVAATDGTTAELTAKSIIIATGARSKQLPNLPQDGEKVIGYRKAMTLEKQPESMIVVGSGAIGSEFAWFYNAIGTKVTLVEYLPNVVPLEDEDVSTGVTYDISMTLYVDDNVAIAELLGTDPLAPTIKLDDTEDYHVHVILETYSSRNPSTAQMLYATVYEYVKWDGWNTPNNAGSTSFAQWELSGSTKTKYIAKKR